jgi:hypothetical protein
MDSGLFGFWLRFGSVTGLFKPAPSPKPRQKSKILAAHRYIISVNALSARRIKTKIDRFEIFRLFEGRVMIRCVAGGLQFLVSAA